MSHAREMALGQMALSVAAVGLMLWAWRRQAKAPHKELQRLNSSIIYIYIYTYNYIIIHSVSHLNGFNENIL